MYKIIINDVEQMYHSVESAILCVLDNAKDFIVKASGGNKVEVLRFNHGGTTQLITIISQIENDYRFINKLDYIKDDDNERFNKFRYRVLVCLRGQEEHCYTVENKLLMHFLIHSNLNGIDVSEVDDEKYIEVWGEDIRGAETSFWVECQDKYDAQHMKDFLSHEINYS